MPSVLSSLSIVPVHCHTSRTQLEVFLTKDNMNVHWGTWVKTKWTRPRKDIDVNPGVTVTQNVVQEVTPPAAPDLLKTQNLSCLSTCKGLRLHFQKIPGLLFPKHIRVQKQNYDNISDRRGYNVLPKKLAGPGRESRWCRAHAASNLIPAQTHGPCWSPGSVAMGEKTKSRSKSSCQSQPRCIILPRTATTFMYEKQFTDYIYLAVGFFFSWDFINILPSWWSHLFSSYLPSCRNLGYDSASHSFSQP